jgi:cell wall assembly regulator SMI1
MRPLKVPGELTVRHQWEKLENYLAQHNPSLLADLNPPATVADIDALQSRLNANLPSDYIDLLMIHNGQRGRSEWLFEGEKFLSTREILMDWSTLCSLEVDGDFDNEVVNPEEGIKDCWWSKCWIPITSNGFGDHRCLDLDPSPEGENGQIINFFHDSPARSQVAKGFGTWFAQFVEKTIK